jgi:DNA-binding transcriptional LysR family regulator
MVAHRLATSERVLCASPNYLEQHGEPMDIGDLAEHRLLAATGQLPWRLMGPSSKVIVEGMSHVQTNSSEVVRELVIAGIGIALRSIWDVNEALASGALKRILAEFEGSNDIGIYAMHMPSPHSNAAIDSLVAFLRDQYSPTPPWNSFLRMP